MAVTLNKTIHLPSGIKIFYREQSQVPNAPIILLLHGFPSSSHQYRNLIPILGAKYRVIAPDLPGFGFTETPSTYKYTFDNLAITMTEFLDELSITKFSIYIFDYGAPTGLRLALQRPDSIQAIISQNGNAYVEGFGDVWAPIQDLWASNNAPEHRAKVAQAMLTLETTKFQYENGSPDISRVAPESYYLDYTLMERPGNKEIQLDLFMDYKNNMPLYEDFQAYFRKSKIPLLALWGKNDVFFIPPGAEAFKRDNPDAEVKFIDAGHFAVETDFEYIGKEILVFLGKLSL
ncbi:hypothetical protein N7448_007491 [Penicillium atrosanguineum]|uniref:AB hydrolase-1 domain-containing protein n=1 Tax=Penicillium atrosanguineum TaxID=1132637 RepID=A0A9W9GQX2_9EURO|nr:uncharacterized protein N7443_001484 [Penicillium atrosanguineum]KAJ5126712.1 hypothetical protein N7448_007491 [Penicillium atrosanguineum]KAJ5314600.1 hypothetical protein N7443_001484 [Penicillium atrosanguineum]KAJ5331771.1 hypothetical protein N7476_001554 [Penicillium atrosanguineum]